jgi:hypothetical protein
VAAAEKVEAYARQIYDLFAHRLPEQERAQLDELIEELDRRKADFDTVTQRAAVCLKPARCSGPAKPCTDWSGLLGSVTPLPDVCLSPSQRRNSRHSPTGALGQQRTHALQQDALVFGFALEAMAAGSVQ